MPEKSLSLYKFLKRKRKTCVDSLKFIKKRKRKKVSTSELKACHIVQHKRKTELHIINLLLCYLENKKYSLATKKWGNSIINSIYGLHYEVQTTFRNWYLNDISFSGLIQTAEEIVVHAARAAILNSPLVSREKRVQAMKQCDGTYYFSHHKNHA